jgi:alpha-tubulin suppressor-like RCC1 family protein
VPGVDDAVQIAGSCALRANGAVACWGANDSGSLGTASAVGDCAGPYNKPCSVAALPVAIQHASTDVSSGWQHACAVAEDGTLECWGHNGYGQLGRPAADSPTCTSGFPCEMLPRRVPNLSGIARVFAGIGSTCALTRDGRALCWGNLPDSYVTSAPAHVPREVALPGKLRSVANERGAACFVLDDGSLYCYGSHFEARAADGIGELLPTGVPLRMCSSGD